MKYTANQMIYTGKVFSQQHLCKYFSQQHLCKLFSQQHLCKYFSQQHLCKYFSQQQLCKCFSQQHICKYFSQQHLCKCFSRQHLCKYVSQQHLCEYFSHHHLCKCFSQQHLCKYFSHQHLCKHKLYVWECLLDTRNTEAYEELIYQKMDVTAPVYYCLKSNMSAPVYCPKFKMLLYLYTSRTSAKIVVENDTPNVSSWCVYILRNTAGACRPPGHTWHLWHSGSAPANTSRVVSRFIANIRHTQVLCVTRHRRCRFAETMASEDTYVESQWSIHDARVLTKQAIYDEC